MSWVLVGVGTIAVAGGVKAYGQYQEGKAQQLMYNYQAALAVQEVMMRRRYAEAQQKAISEAAAANVTIEQAAAAEKSRILAGDLAELSGRQRATIGALGIGGVTAADIAVSTFDKGQLDQLAIRYNANIRSWGIRGEARRDIWTLGEETKMKTWALRSESSQFRLAGRQAKRAARIRVAGTILSTASQMATIGALSVPGGGGGTGTASGTGFRSGTRTVITA